LDREDCVCMCSWVTSNKSHRSPSIYCMARQVRWFVQFLINLKVSNREVQEICLFQSHKHPTETLSNECLAYKSLSTSENFVAVMSVLLEICNLKLQGWGDLFMTY
jgi:hypothetical protein